MDRDEGLAVLAGRGWLAAAGQDFATTFLSLARWRTYEPGEAMTLAGEDRTDLIGLAHGTVALATTFGRAESTVIHLAPSVVWMGYGPALRDRERVVTVEARTQVWAARFPARRIKAMLDAGTLDWRGFMLLSGEYGDLMSLIAADLLIPGTRPRLAAVLARFAGLRTPLSGVVPDVVVPATQVELAAAANMSRNVAGAILRELAAAGVVDTSYGGIVIRDPVALLQRAGGEAAPPRPL